MYDNPVYPLSGGIVSANKAAEAAGLEAKNFRDQIDKHLRLGKPLTRNLKAKLLASFTPLHDEVRLHTYTARLFRAATVLREAEDRARARFDEMDGPMTVEDVRKAFETGQSNVADIFLDTINKGIDLDNREVTLTDEDRTTVYLAAAAQHSRLVIWEDAAQAMLRVKAEDPEDMVLDFEGEGSVIDITERAFDLYSLVEMELREIRRRSIQEQANLAEHDLGIVSLNMASISSHALDWIRSEDDYLVISGIPKTEAIRRLSRLAGVSHQTLKKAVALMKRHARHVLVARNVAYMALQHDDPAALGEAAAQIATQHGTEPTEVWSIRIADREPLLTEPNIAHKFKDGRPIILETEEAE